MQPKDYIKNKARKLAKQTWAGPGKFGVFIIICIVVIAFFESLGLSNREKNLEMRNVQNIVIPINFSLEKMNEGLDQIKNEVMATQKQKQKISLQIQSEKSNSERENILLSGAMEQYLFEHQQFVDNYENIQNTNDKTKLFMSILLKEKDEIIKSASDDLFMFDV